jgi:gamma-glutamyl:cysteine ligase YbdK (ATP-grasp superfamily)
VTGWAAWAGGTPLPAAYTLGAEEEVMLLRPGDWSLAQAFEEVLPSLSPYLTAHVTGETHGATLELRTGVHRNVRQAAVELRALRAQLARDLAVSGLAAACCGLHPFAVWQAASRSPGARRRAAVCRGATRVREGLSCDPNCTATGAGQSCPAPRP